MSTGTTVNTEQQCLELSELLHLHDAVPVVSCRHPEEQQEGHPKVSERRVASEAFARVQLVTY